jgi:hypothetical protein
MTLSTPFVALNFSVKEGRTWLFSLLFVAGNILLPQLCHLIPNGGLIFLPIYFFTLIAAYKFGTPVGLLTAVFSPIANSLLFGMPPVAILPVILIKSGLLALLAGTIAHKSRSVSLPLIALVVIAYQFLGGLIEGLLVQDWTAGLQDLRIGYPGLLLQVFGGWIVLKTMARYER